MPLKSNRYNNWFVALDRTGEGCIDAGSCTISTSLHGSYISTAYIDSSKLGHTSLRSPTSHIRHTHRPVERRSISGARL
ncbi:hypothetical protein PGTUg99_010828 [Puccinia graminis f. sp. tritici]|uniref:Uncharacterized protein n=1 Tax=Puccinia graminis f. sp. tritici TaxID=56615 RepID=A0A5B0RJK1_PUCGR|nr:hypothetical protein PGTUg99_010828 [Puccinia graminis f. sp. tritici]